MRVEKDHTNNTANKNVGMHANRRDEKRKRVQIENRKKNNSGTHGNVLRDMTNDEQRQVAFSLKKKAHGEKRERETTTPLTTTTILLLRLSSSRA